MGNVLFVSGLPVLSRMDFGHTDPVIVLPYRVQRLFTLTGTDTVWRQI